MSWGAGRSWITGKNWIMGRSWIAGKSWIVGKSWIIGRSWITNTTTPDRDALAILLLVPLYLHVCSALSELQSS